MHADAVAVLGGPPDLVDVAEVDHRVDALAVQVQAEGDQVDVARALAVAEQAALDPLRAGQHGQLGVGGGGAAVVVGVHRQRDVLAPGQVAADPLDLVGVDVRRGPLDRARQVQHDLPARAGLPDVHDRLADLQREVQLGVHEDLGRVLVAEVGAGQVLLGVLHAPRGCPRRRPPCTPPGRHRPSRTRRCGRAARPRCTCARWPAWRRPATGRSARSAPRGPGSAPRCGRRPGSRRSRSGCG